MGRFSFLSGLFGGGELRNAGILLVVKCKVRVWVFFSLYVAASSFSHFLFPFPLFAFSLSSFLSRGFWVAFFGRFPVGFVLFGTRNKTITKNKYILPKFNFAFMRHLGGQFMLSSLFGGLLCRFPSSFIWCGGVPDMVFRVFLFSSSSAFAPSGLESLHSC